jgi:D-alanyl-D-alanine carboxypeptidase (penicillin-binding protein 5/6)
MLPADQDCIGSVTEEAKQRSGYTLPSYWLVTDCSHIGIKKGEILSLRDLLFGMMVASADDASNVVAQKLGNGSIPNFMEGMNVFIKELGCKDTYFNNPHGLHHPKHVTTAYDMALITKEALKNPLFREMVATSRCTRPKTNKQDSTILVQTNRLLRAGEYYYPRAIGVKTGRTSKAGSTFVAAAKEGDRTLIAVMMNVKERKDIFRDAIRLFDAAFNQLKIEKTVIQAGSQRHSFELEGAEKLIKTYSEEDVALAYYPAEEPKIKAFLQWDKLELPVKKGQRVGELQLKTDDQKVLRAVPLFAQEDVEGKFNFKMQEFFKGKGSKILLVTGLAALIAGGIYLVSRRSRR